MTISKGDRIPDATLVKWTEGGPEKVQSADYFAGKKVALFSVPGAFTPTCSVKHLPGYVEKAAELKAKGVDEIVATAVNDAFVLGAWNKASGSSDITMLADGNGAARFSSRLYLGPPAGLWAHPETGVRMEPRLRPTRKREENARGHCCRRRERLHRP